MNRDSSEMFGLSLQGLLLLLLFLVFPVVITNESKLHEKFLLVSYLHDFRTQEGKLLTRVHVLSQFPSLISFIILLRSYAFGPLTMVNIQILGLVVCCMLLFLDLLWFGS